MKEYLKPDFIEIALEVEEEITTDSDKTGMDFEEEYE